MPLDTPAMQALIAVCAVLGLYVLLNWAIIPLLLRLVAKTESKLDDALLQPSLLRSLSLLACVSVLLVYSHSVPQQSLLRSALGQNLLHSALGQNLLKASLILAVVWTLLSALSAGERVYRHLNLHTRLYSIRGYVQLVKLFVVLFALLLLVAVLTGQPLIYYLSGFGAVLAAALFVFRDTILSFIATLQIGNDRLLRVGEWVEMPDYQVDGEVTEISLHTVKVRNWDKTISSVPTLKVVDTALKNWRGMEEVRGRRIKRAIHMDLSSIRWLTEHEQEYFSRYRPLRDYMVRKRKEIDRYNAAQQALGDEVAELRRLTNLGTFRAYVESYLRAHPQLHPTERMTQMVRQLPPGPQGMPLEIYTFTTTTDWADYEKIQADLFDHLLSLMGEFGLRAYQTGMLEALARQGRQLYPDPRHRAE